MSYCRKIGERTFFSFRTYFFSIDDGWIRLGLDAGPGRLLGENGWISKCKSFIHSLEVVNDCAERGVKLITDFNDVTKYVQQQQYLFQVIFGFK
jgi:hypothetical protein